MEHEVKYDFDHEDHFWHGTFALASPQLHLNPARDSTNMPRGSCLALDEIISHECENHTYIDDTLRSYLAIISSCRGMSVKCSQGDKRTPKTNTPLTRALSPYRS